MPTLKRTGHFKLPTGVLGADLSEDGCALAAACMDGVYRADLNTAVSEKIDEHESYVSSAAFIDTSTVVSAGYDGCVRWTEVGSATTFRSIKVHDFWSWDMAVSPDRTKIASVTGQYIAGDYRYEPLPEREPSVVVLTVDSGEVLYRFSHVPSVQAVAFSPDGRYVAAGNLMGEVRIWDCVSGELAAKFTTPAFTSWGIIKSHCYLGGIFAIRFTPKGDELLLAGMGPMRDPMAGNGKQLWQKWSWQNGEPHLVDETHKGENGEGLMETLAVHPVGQQFVMGGRLRGGAWNTAVFDLSNGSRTASLKTGYRVTQALFSKDGERLVLVGAQGQPNSAKDGVFSDYGRVEVYEIA